MYRRFSFCTYFVIREKTKLYRWYTVYRNQCTIPCSSSPQSKLENRVLLVLLMPLMHALIAVGRNTFWFWFWNVPSTNFWRSDLYECFYYLPTRFQKTKLKCHSLAVTETEKETETVLISWTYNFRVTCSLMTGNRYHWHVNKARYSSNLSRV